MAQTATLNPVQTRIDDDLLRRLDERCEADRRSRSYVLEQALRALLDSEPASLEKAA